MCGGLGVSFEGGARTGLMPRMVGGKDSLVRRELDGLVRHLVDDVERLERPASPRRLLLDDADLLLAVQEIGLAALTDRFSRRLQS